MKKYAILLICLLLVGNIVEAQINVSGTVKEKNGSVLPGAKVHVKGTQISAMTDLDGKYTIAVPEGSNVLVFIFLDMKQQEIQIENKTTINVELESSGTKAKRKTTNPTEKKVYFGPGIGIGIFYPGDVNDYIEQDLQRNNYSITGGFSEMFMYYSLRGFVGIRPVKFLEIDIIAEYSIAPKIFFVSGSDNLSYQFTRFAPGGLVSLHIPFGSGRHSFSIGGGAMYHNMKFADFNAKAIGFRGQFGMNFRFKSKYLQIFWGGEYVAGDDTYDNTTIELNYSGGFIGFNFGF